MLKQKNPQDVWPGLLAVDLPVQRGLESNAGDFVEILASEGRFVDSHHVINGRITDRFVNLMNGRIVVVICLTTLVEQICKEIQYFTKIALTFIECQKDPKQLIHTVIRM